MLNKSYVHENSTTCNMLGEKKNYMKIFTKVKQLFKKIEKYHFTEILDNIKQKENVLYTENLMEKEY